LALDVPPYRDGRIYLTEGGTETELLFKWGFALPEFAMFPLLDDPEARRVMDEMFRRHLDVAAACGTGMVLAGLDYRASPDWGAKLGYSPEELAEMQCRSIRFLAELRDAYADTVSDVYIAGILGPRGDAYGTGGTITEAEAEDYHAVQLETLKGSEADLAITLTFNNVPEAVGTVRAATAAGLPLGVNLTLTTEGRLRSGPTLRDAIETIDARTGGAAAWFGTNCSHPVEFEPAFADSGPWIERIRYVRPNAARMDKIALCKLGHLEDGDPVELGGQMRDLVERFPWIDILGGCCGTDERHLREIARNCRTVRASEDA